jgi:hypothetical protein
VVHEAQVSEADGLARAVAEFVAKGKGLIKVIHGVELVANAPKGLSEQTEGLGEPERITRAPAPEKAALQNLNGLTHLGAPQQLAPKCKQRQGRVPYVAGVVEQLGGEHGLLGRQRRAALRHVKIRLFHIYKVCSIFMSITKEIVFEKISFYLYLGGLNERQQQVAGRLASDVAYLGGHTLGLA